MTRRQFRIYVNGTFQFDLHTDKSAGQVAQNAAEAMKINVKSAEFSPGLINLLTY